jgi:hypothetical protein
MHTPGITQLSIQRNCNILQEKALNTPPSPPHLRFPWEAINLNIKLRKILNAENLT